MVTYNLSHLTQLDDQAVGGPIQDDEALLLFALVRVMRLKRILEVGGLSGYSAMNFLQAVGPEGTVFTVDIDPVPTLAPNHIVIQKNVEELTSHELGHDPIDLLFFDCHVYDAQMKALERLQSAGLVVDETVIALHDTNLHPKQFASWAYPVEDGWVHQAVERKMVNDLKGLGYEVIPFHTKMDAHDDSFPYRHGVTIARKFKQLSL